MIYFMMRTVVAPTMRAVWRPTVQGRENIPRSGGVILASNHRSFIDSFLIPMTSPRPVYFLAKADYFTGAGIKGAFNRAWFTGMGMIPVERDDSRAAVDSLDTALEVLRRGDAFGIYPEGTRSRDGRLYRGHTGVAHLALTAKVPVVPVGLQGTQNVQPVGESRLHLAPMTIRFGTPLRFADRFAGVPAGRARRQVTDEVMAAIAGLCGQEVAPGYNERSSNPA